MCQSNDVGVPGAVRAYATCLPTAYRTRCAFRLDVRGKSAQSRHDAGARTCAQLAFRSRVSKAWRSTEEYDMITVTGATGKLGRLVVEGLLERVPADHVVAAVRSPEKAADLADR